MCSVIIESESRLEGWVGDGGFKIVYQSGCGDADHSDGLNGTARSGTKGVIPPPAAHGRMRHFIRRENRESGI